MFKRYFLLLVLLLGACAPAEDATDQARQALVTFFESLSTGRYAEAAEYYGGDYEVLTYYNPSLDPDDHVALWENACTINGAQCLPVRSATLKEQTGDEYIFLVEFSNPGGSLFVLGPCCGATETEMPPISQFDYRVKKTSDGKFVVLDIPVYVP
jgi:hypothetical protein